MKNFSLLFALITLLVAFPGCTKDKSSRSGEPSDLPADGASSSDSFDPYAGGVKLGIGQYASTVSWDANLDAGVNKTGGGYRVYYQKSPNVDLTLAQFADVPYKSGSQAPVSVLFTGLEASTYYFKIVAYSGIKRSVSTAALSGASPEISLSLP